METPRTVTRTWDRQATAYEPPRPALPTPAVRRPSVEVVRGGVAAREEAAP